MTWRALAHPGSREEYQAEGNQVVRDQREVEYEEGHRPRAWIHGGQEMNLLMRFEKEQS